MLDICREKGMPRNIGSKSDSLGYCTIFYRHLCTIYIYRAQFLPGGSTSWKRCAIIQSHTIAAPPSPHCLISRRMSLVSRILVFHIELLLRRDLLDLPSYCRGMTVSTKMIWGSSYMDRTCRFLSLRYCSVFRPFRVLRRLRNP